MQHTPFHNLEPTRGCLQGTYARPAKVSDGVHFNDETQTLRLENANNLGLTSTFTVALWVKLLDRMNPSQSLQALFSIYRYDAYSNLEDPNIFLGFYNDNGRYFFYFRSNLQQYNYPLNSQNIQEYVQQNATLTEGWFLVSLSLDSSSLRNTKYQIRVRTPFNGSENRNNQINDFIYNTNVTRAMKSDIYLGGYCEKYDNYDRFYRGLIGFTIGRLYIWKNTANTANDVAFDRFFFRQSVPTPVCQGTIPCSFCVQGYPFPPTVIQPANLTCTIEGQTKSKTYIALWDFDSDYSEQILDQSGNGYHLYRDPVNNQASTEKIWRIFGQGYLFDYDTQMFGRPYIQLDKYSQFTIDLWFRREPVGFYNATENHHAIQMLDIVSNSQCIFCIGINQQTSESFLLLSNQPYISSFSNLLNTTQWTYYQLSLHFYKQYYSEDWFSMKTTIDNDTRLYIQRTNQPFKIPDQSIMYIWSGRSLIIKSMRIYGYAKMNDETGVMTKKNTSCARIGNQPQCNICPTETSRCLSVCNQTQFGVNCTNCHSFCGHCNDSTRNGCVYCSRNTNITKVFYSSIYGNCTCIPGFYYNSTSDSCQPCHINCQECYGPTNSQCLTCSIGKLFFPDSKCVNNCQDSLVTNNDPTQGYYQANETINGKVFSLCSKCHPACTACTNSGNNQCTACNDGYLLINGNTCSDTCLAGFYANFTQKKCLACDATCQSCSGPGNNECLLCKDPRLYQQSGTCQAACDNGFYPDSNSVCQPCDPACATCLTKYSTNCSACNSGYYLQWLGFACKTSCSPGNYADNITNQCLLCHYSCQTCSGSGADKCTKCAPGFLRRGSFCVTACEDGEFSIDGICQTCDSKCTTCFGILDTQCYSCAENTLTGQGYYFFNNTCQNSCPSGFYPDNLSRTCKKCKTECATCISESFCTSCIYGPYKLNNGECTYFTCLNTQYRALRPSLTCYDCDDSCLTCQGFSQFDCLTCKPQFQFYQQQCLTCDDQPGMTKSKDESVSNCIEICGDGFNYGYVQCDDGNNIDGDGCSSSCQIEEGYACQGGSKMTPDICADIKNPTSKIALVNSKNQVFIQFDKEVSLQDTFDEKTFQVSVTGPQSSYKFEWRLNDEYKTTQPTQTIVIDLTFYQSLKGEQKEQVTMQFLSSQIYLDNSGNGVVRIPMSSYLNSFEYIDPATKAQLDQAGESSMLATFGAMAINLAISLIFGGTISAMWVMVNTIQLVSLLPLCNINYPQITTLVFSKMLAAHGESTFIPNVIYDQFLNRTGSQIQVEEALTERFTLYGWTVSNFLYLSGRKILIWAAMLIAYPFVWYMKKKYADKHKFCRLWISAEQKFRYTLLLRAIIMSYVSMYLAAILNIYQMNFGTMENVVSIFSAIAFAILLTYLPIQIMNILQRNYAKIKSEKFMQQYSTIVQEVDLSHPLRYMYYSVFLLRRAFFALQLVILANQPKAQIALMSATSLLMFIYIIVLRPQSDRIMIILNAAGELLLLFLHLISIVFLDDTLTEEKSTQLGWFVIVVVGAYVLINWVIIFTLTVKDLCRQYREYKQQKLKTKEQLKEDEEYKIWKKKRQVKKRIEKEKDRQNLLNLQQKRAQDYEKQKEQEEIKSQQLVLAQNNNENTKDFMSLEDQEGDSGSPNPFYNSTMSKNILNESGQFLLGNNGNQDKFQSSFMTKTQPLQINNNTRNTQSFNLKLTENNIGMNQDNNNQLTDDEFWNYNQPKVNENVNDEQEQVEPQHQQQNQEGLL